MSGPAGVQCHSVIAILAQAISMTGGTIRSVSGRIS